MLIRTTNTVRKHLALPWVPLKINVGPDRQDGVNVGSVSWNPP